ncbi:MAG: family 10 glycosylhydrolase [Ferruginibacter sp.]
MKLFFKLSIANRRLPVAGCLLIIAHCLLPGNLKAQATPEFRGVWVATVDNIDWPGKGSFNSDSQKTAFIRLLDMHQRNGLNALIVQVRPCADAFYPSQYEPWSEWLTGVQGQPPAPYYDPLAFMIAETHKRGMVFHAWINPYRAVFNIDKSSVSATHITKLHPGWFLTYGDKRYFDPGNKEAQQYVVQVVADVVSRYDVDAVHFDDYFYPYRIAGKEFPDDSGYQQYGKGMKKDDWRRSNTDSIISMLSRAIKKEKKKCQFGISPFGVWRNQDKDGVDGSRTNGAQSNYDDLYADILLWLKKDWIDYVAPQLYWEFGHRIAPYEILLDWWSRHTYGKHCYIGMGIYKANSNAAWKDVTQLPRQIQAMRSTPNLKGMIFFSSKSFENNPNGWNDSLRLNYFKDPVKVPEMDWLK